MPRRIERWKSSLSSMIPRIFNFFFCFDFFLHWPLINIAKWNHLWFTEWLVVEHQLNGLKEVKRNRHNKTSWACRLCVSCCASCQGCPTARRIMLFEQLFWRFILSVDWCVSANMQLLFGRLEWNLQQPPSANFLPPFRNHSVDVLANLKVAFVVAWSGWWLEARKYIGVIKSRCWWVFLFVFIFLFYSLSPLLKYKCVSWKVTRDERRKKLKQVLFRSSRKTSRKE